MGCPGLVSSSQSIGRGLSKVSATLFIQELSDRKAGYLVCCPQSTYCYYPVQLSQSGKRIENIAYAEKPIDWDLVKEVQEIIGDQMCVSWANS